MKRLSLCVFAAMVLGAGLFCSCAEKKPQGPPQQLLDEIAQTEAIYEEATRFEPTKDDVSHYLDLIGSARKAMDAGEYKSAMDKARRARLEAVTLSARLTYRELMKYHPPHTLTYHYRQHSKASEDAMAEGDIDQAIEAAKEARHQAELALEFQKQCLVKASEDLDRLKKEIELIYRPSYEMFKLYWDARDVIKEKECSRVEKMVEELKRLVENSKLYTVGSDRTFIVTSPPEFVRVYGDPVMYQEVTPQGLKGQLTRVPVGQPVIFIRSLFLSREKTYYYVEDTRTGIRGWMAEERVWPERAIRH